MTEEVVRIGASEHETVDFSGMEDSLRTQILDIVGDEDYDPCDALKLLGLDWDGRSRSKVRCSYYVGCVWIRPGRSILSVRPKLPFLDFRKMLSVCASVGTVAMKEQLADIVRLDYDAPPLPASRIPEELSILVVTRFLTLMDKVAARLRRSYTTHTVTFRGKVKGKPLIRPTLVRRFASGKFDMMDCAVSRFTADCAENRLLKRAVRLCRTWLRNYSWISGWSRLEGVCSHILGTMAEVKDVPQRSLKASRDRKRNPFYAAYPELLKLASLIVRQMDSDSSGRERNCPMGMPPYAINMARLFELYVYALLHNRFGHQIEYHYSTYGNELDFIKHDESLIIDTKYKPRWNSSGGSRHHDVRQLSGYGRHRKIRSHIMDDDGTSLRMLDCLVIYPDVEGTEDFSEIGRLMDIAKADRDYVRFSMLGVRLPVLRRQGEEQSVSEVSD